MVNRYSGRGQQRRRSYGVAEWNSPYRQQDDRNWTVPGPFTGYGPRGYRRSDELIREEVCERLKLHGRIDASKIRVEVRNGEVTLYGAVKDRRTKLRAEETTASVYSVRDVHNRLRLWSLPGEAAAERNRRTGRPKQGALVFETNGDSDE